MRASAVAALVAGLILLAACSWNGSNTATDDNTVNQSFTSVRIASDSGAVKIRAGSTATVHRTIHYDKNRPGSTYHVENSTLVVDSCGERGCSIDYELTVPAGTRVDGKVDSGKVEVDGVAAVNLKIDSGSTTVRHVSGKVNLDASSGWVDVADVADVVAVRSESGRVTVANVRAAVTVQTQSGSVTVGLADPQDVRVQADSGNVTVTVPRADYQVRAQADSGRVNSAVGDQPSGSHQLDLRADSGNITLNYA
jgi:hypothetical protein